MATRTTKRADNANRPGRPPSRLKCGTRHLKLYESRDILGAAQGSPRDARSGLEPGRSSQAPAIATIWFTGRRSAQIRSRSPRATGHWRAVRWIDHRLDPAHGQSASFSNKTDPPRTPGNDSATPLRGSGCRIARPVRPVTTATRVHTNGRYVLQEPAMPIEPVDIPIRRYADSYCLPQVVPA